MKRLLTRAITRLDYDRVSSCGIFYLQAAYWKARRCGLMKEAAWRGEAANGNRSAIYVEKSLAS